MKVCTLSVLQAVCYRRTHAGACMQVHGVAHADPGLAAHALMLNISSVAYLVRLESALYVHITVDWLEPASMSPGGACMSAYLHACSGVKRSSYCWHKYACLRLRTCVHTSCLYSMHA